MTGAGSLTRMSRTPYALRAVTSLYLDAPVPLAEPRTLTVAMTGASGAVFTRQFLLLAERDRRVTRVNFIASDNALRVAAEELGLTGRAHLLRQLLGKESKKIALQSNADIGANVASGSYPTDAMVVIPCSMGTLARIAAPSLVR